MSELDKYQFLRTLRLQIFDILLFCFCVRYDMIVCGGRQASVASCFVGTIWYIHMLLSMVGCGIMYSSLVR